MTATVKGTRIVSVRFPDNKWRDVITSKIGSGPFQFLIEYDNLREAKDGWIRVVNPDGRVSLLRHFTQIDIYPQRLHTQFDPWYDDTPGSAYEERI